MKLYVVSITCLLIFCLGCRQKAIPGEDSVIASGQMPGVAVDKRGNVHVVYGSGDSLMYTYSGDQGKTFVPGSLIYIIPKLTASHTRGPQVAITETGLAVIACNEPGDIFSFVKREGSWVKSTRVNDVDTVAKENFTALSADGNNLFAVWLDLRDRHNKIFGAKSSDGGSTWSKNLFVYASPDTTVCECCKPSVVIKGSNVFVMFRNWLNGNRDLYLIRSTNGGGTFGQAEKLGFASWPLKGCPMDGGSIVVDDNGNPKTVWNRQGIIYACDPGKQERAIGKGRNCTLETLNGREVYAWVEDKEVFIGELEGKKQLLGQGKLPVIKAMGNNKIICLWETEGKIHKSIFYL